MTKFTTTSEMFWRALRLIYNSLEVVAKSLQLIVTTSKES